ncbi:hypothetical protein [Synechococcus phage S-H38]|uniref:DUF1583 domain-containing protein n=1 Tax=Synechococcus phage S-H38 TaxID=2783673 RepID=A0A873WDJ4_9CAUD|nr:hypothetical protein PQC14_gp023 [Synechococcus phage S-H38]QPB08038.1 hypothetical protein [Synechococcus phage S-H38]
MQFYYNLNPPGYEGESDIVTIEAPSEVMDVLFQYSKQISDQTNAHQSKAVKDVLKESVNTIIEKHNDRKNRKTKKR